MWHIGIDLHRSTVVIAGVNDNGTAFSPVTVSCWDEPQIIKTLKGLTPFRAVIEATATYRWLYNLLSPYGTVLLAHPLKLHAMIQQRSKTDKIDAMLLAQLLRINQIPLAYIPGERYQYLRDITRHRVRLGRESAKIKTEVKSLLARHNIRTPYKEMTGPRGENYLLRQDFGFADNWVRDNLLTRLRTVQVQIIAAGEIFESVKNDYPEVEALLDIHGIGLYTALLIIGEIGEPERFADGAQVSAYAGLTARVNQSGGHCYYGHITKQGSAWLRWILVEAGMQAIKRDSKLANFYARIRKRSSGKIARVAAARKLAGICWVRLRKWHRAHSRVTCSTAV